jgi:hypothetical protein
VADPCKHNSKIIGSSKFGKFLDELKITASQGEVYSMELFLTMG